MASNRVIGNKSSHPLKWVVTAPPRSGTTWIGHFLSNRGFRTAHESCFRLLGDDPTVPRFVDANYPGESSYLAAPWSSQLRAMGITVIHLRRPLEDVARSMLRLGWDFTSGWPAVEAFTPQIFDEEPKSFTQYHRFASDWTDLIDADAVWDLYDVGDRELTWMNERFGTS